MPLLLFLEYQVIILKGLSNFILAFWRKDVSTSSIHHAEVNLLILSLKKYQEFQLESEK